MKLRFPLLTIFLLSQLICVPVTRADDNGRTTADKARDVLNKLVDEAQKAAKGVEKKSKQLWEHTKENLRLGKEEYLGKTGSALGTMQAEVQGIVEADTGVAGREYFKTRVESLKQHVEYCKREWTKLKEIGDEETFRVKQKGFDRSMGFLSDNIELTKDEAGL